MATTTFTLDVSYAQVAVFTAGMETPFNDWTDLHVAQGFSWRPESVSFRTLDEAGALKVHVEAGAPIDMATSTAKRIIRVPFTVSDPGKIEVASIGGSAMLRASPGAYEITFEHGSDPTMGMWCKLYFRRTEDIVTPAILRADDELSPGEQLVMTAEPARYG